MQDPVIDQINASVDRLTHSTNFLQFLGQHALIVQEDIPSAAEDHVDDQRYHFMSLLLNLANTSLYMVNTYIIVPTADDYSLSLGAAATVFYFGWFILVVPFVGIIENTLMDIALIEQTSSADINKNTILSSNLS